MSDETTNFDYTRDPCPVCGADPDSDCAGADDPDAVCPSWELFVAHRKASANTTDLPAIRNTESILKRGCSRDGTEVTTKAPYMELDRFRPMPVDAVELLTLADHLCDWACEISNQREPAEPWSKSDGTSIPFERAPTWAFDKLSDALNAYYEARHRP